MLYSPTPLGRKTPILSLKSQSSWKKRLARVVLSLGRSEHCRPLSTAFWELGWNVHLATSLHDLVRQVRKVRPHVVALLAEQPGQESGWLAAKKLLMEQPKLKVILLAEQPTERERRLAKFVGAVDCLPLTLPWAAVYTAMGVESLSSK
jgi:CheY-like chemotaxis protein